MELLKSRLRLGIAVGINLILGRDSLLFVLRLAREPWVLFLLVNCKLLSLGSEGFSWLGVGKLKLRGVLLSDSLRISLIVLHGGAKNWSISHRISPGESIVIVFSTKLVIITELEVTLASRSMMHFNRGFGSLRTKLSLIL